MPGFLKAIILMSVFKTFYRRRRDSLSRFPALGLRPAPAGGRPCCRLSARGCSSPFAAALLWRGSGSSPGSAGSARIRAAGEEGPGTCIEAQGSSPCQPPSCFCGRGRLGPRTAWRGGWHPGEAQDAGTPRRTEGHHAGQKDTRLPRCRGLGSSPPAPRRGCAGREGAAPAPRSERGLGRCPPASPCLTLLYAPLFSTSPRASPCPARAGAVLSRPGCGAGGGPSPPAPRW